MAEQSSTALKELDEQLTCSVCLDQYTNPKTLQCHHSFCLTCIERLPQEPQVTHTQYIFMYIGGLLLMYCKSVMLSLHGLYTSLSTTTEYTTLKYYINTKKNKKGKSM